MTVLRGTGLGEPAGRGRPGGARARGPARVPQAAAMVCGQGARARVGPDRRGGAPPGIPRGDALLPGRDALPRRPVRHLFRARPGWPAAPRPSGSPARRPAGSSPGSTARAAIACSTTAWPIPRSARPCSTRSPRSASCAAQSGEVRAIRTPQFGEARGPSGTPLEVIRGKAEQSNTAVMFDHRLILKVFRRVEPGINPDFEIGRFLGERTQFDRVPKVAGALEYHRRRAEPTSLAILQELVPNQGNGWEHALHELRGYYERAARRPADRRAGDRPRTILPRPGRSGAAAGRPGPDRLLLEGGDPARPPDRRAAPRPGQRPQGPRVRPRAALPRRPRGAAPAG